MSKMFSCLDSKTSFDSYGVANIVLNKCYLHLSLPLFLLFNKSLSSGVFLDRLKISKHVAIHKSGCKQDICNYRPISKTPCVPKIFEKIVCDKLMPLINKSLCENQDGFRQGRSTITNLILFFQTSSIQILVIVCTDFAKAFDKVDHPTLLLKYFRQKINNTKLDLILFSI